MSPYFEIPTSVSEEIGPIAAVLCDQIYISWYMEAVMKLTHRLQRVLRVLYLLTYIFTVTLDLIQLIVLSV